jgi:nitrate/nitrite-specific signal transduction histidine kinase
MTIRVEDDGTGIPAGLETRGMGLRIMGFRATMIRAALDIHANGNGGTVVQVSLSGATAAWVEP